MTSLSYDFGSIKVVIVVMGRGKITLTNYPVQLWRSLVLTIQNVIPNVLLVPSPLSSSVTSVKAMGYYVTFDVMVGA